MFGNGFGGCSCLFSEMLVFDRILTVAERASVMSYLSARYGISVLQLSPYHVIADGDSITAGYTVSPLDDRFTDYSLQFFDGRVSDCNIAIAGETFQQMLDSVSNPSGAQRLWLATAKAQGAIPISFCGGGYNDITGPAPYEGGLTAAELFTVATNYFAAMKSYGAQYTIGWTLTPSTNTYINAVRLEYNAMLRSSFASANIDILVDAALDPQLQGNPSELSPDGVHWYAIAQPILANHWAPGVLSLLGSLGLASASVSSGPEAGGTSVTLSGTGIGNAQVKNIALAGMSAASFVAVDDNTLQVVTSEAFQTGSGDITIYGPEGSATLPGAFTYD
jgi:lysophospholipase L1-like esterase